MNVRVHPYRQVQTGRGRRGVAAWCSAFCAAASLFFAAAPQAAAQARALPGTIQAEDFDAGANGYAYRDTTSGNAGGQYRSTDVDIESSSEGGYNVGWAAPGEWLNYTVNVAAAGTYTFEARVASASGGGFYVHFNGVNATGTMYVPATGGWQSWTTIRKTITLAAGTQSMRVTFDSGAVNLNYVTLTSSSGTVTSSSGSGSGSGSTGGSSPFGGVALAIPGWVQAEDFDAGGQNVAYYDATPGNAGGAYRSTDVDIEPTGSGGYAVGWIGAGEWLKYTVNVSAAGTYTLVARVASAGSGGTFHVEFNGTDKTGALRVQNTGGWQSYQDLVAQVSLSSGVQTMRLVFDSNGTTGAVGNISAVRFDTGSTTAPAPEPAPAPAPTPAPTYSSSRLRMMTWNINFGGGNTSAQAQLIANSGADTVVLQEASTYDENMPVTYRDRLQQLTGNTWYSAWGPSQSGASQGTLILSRYPILNSTATVLEGTGTVRAQIDVNGVRVQVFAVHLEYYDTAKRTRQLSLLMSWAKQFAGPRLVGGDFNSWWGESWIQTMETEYSDTWEMVSGSVQNGYTLNGSVRFDYLFRSFTDESRIRPTSCWVQSTSLSDHWPVIADYSVQ
jgi:endonuclease/exonuclease/phosphatase family metal-dependent hydrolase